MTDKKEPKSKSLTESDASLWKEMTEDVRRLPGKTLQEPMADEEEERGKSAAPREIVVHPQEEKTQKQARGKDLDGKTDERLRKGKLPIEATLDLHGMRQEEARVKLISFIETAHARGQRCILVITGKGKTRREEREWFEEQPGVLRDRVPEWLRREPIDNLVLKFYQAQPKDGGTGALYVYLRRQR